MTLDAYLREEGETQDSFAARAGIGLATIWRIRKTGARSTAVIEKIVSATDGKVTAADLMPNVASESKPATKRKSRRSAA